MQRSARLTDEALQRIGEISEYIRTDSPQNAMRWRAGLRDKIQRLAESPSSHAVLYTEEQVGREVRQSFFGVYRILYTIEEPGIVVLTVRHGALRPTGASEVVGIE